MKEKETTNEFFDYSANFLLPTNKKKRLNDEALEFS